MPRRKQHREFTLRKYGVTGDDIHKWTDERYQDLGVRHRQERHQYNEWLPKRFIKVWITSCESDSSKPCVAR
ncbi:MAG: hypothetical protein NWE83_00420 [Candidatus Bathyarchaeota archaeon]|nr:hypothetical protein [Candidatus Bathyarchaeota archaeon]